MSFKTSSFSVYGVIYIIHTKVLTADGLTYSVSVSYDSDAGIPSDAKLDVDEITEGATYDGYVARAEQALGMNEGSAEYVRLFDIKIVDRSGEKVQPAEGKNLDVKIALDDSESNALSVVHFADDSDTGEVVENTAEDGGGVAFEAEGFSVYAIVDAPEPTVVEVKRVKELTELEENPDTGFYLSYNGNNFFTNSLNENNAFIEATQPSNASEWYFEPLVNEANKYYIYTFVGGEKKYINNNSGNLVELNAIMRCINPMVLP